MKIRGLFLLVLTLTLYPGGIGQQVAPIRLWLTGHRFDRHAGAVDDVEVNDVDPLEIAEKELKEKKLPFIIRR